MRIHNKENEHSRRNRTKHNESGARDSYLADAIFRFKRVIRKHGLDGLPPESLPEES